MKALKELWSRYERLFENNPVLNEIFMRGFCYSEVSRRDILVMGINPSFRQQENETVKNCKCLSFKYDNVKSNDRTSDKSGILWAIWITRPIIWMYSIIGK